MPCGEGEDLNARLGLSARIRDRPCNGRTRGKRNLNAGYLPALGDFYILFCGLLGSFF